MGQCQVYTCEDPGNQSVGHSTACWRASQPSCTGPQADLVNPMPCFSKDDHTHLQYEHVASCRLGLGSTSPTPLSLSLWWTGIGGWVDILSLPMCQGTVNGYSRWTGISNTAVHVNLKTTTAKQLTRQISEVNQYLPTQSPPLSPGDSTVPSKIPVSSGHR